MLGSFGDIVFEVSAEKILTFRNFTSSFKAVYAEHNLLNAKNKLEFTGLSAGDFSLDVNLRENLGVDVNSELERLKEILQNHKAVYLILYGKPQGDGAFVLTDYSVKSSVIDKNGKCTACEVSLKLKEYI